jgi:hypothetical protein
MRNTLTLEREEKKMAETIGMVLDRIEAQQAKELEALPHDHTALQLRASTLQVQLVGRQHLSDRMS